MKRVMGTAWRWVTVVVWCSLVPSAPGEQAKNPGGNEEPVGTVLAVNDSEMRRGFERGMTKVIDEESCRKVDDLRGELERRSCRLELPDPKPETPGPVEVYKQCRQGVVMISTFFHCPDPECKRWHSNIATGFLIHPEGIVVTNHHVLGSAPEGAAALGVRTPDGEVYAVQEVLASNSKDDVAILRLATERTDFPYLALGKDRPAGSEVTVISHPDNEYYSLTRGYVSRHFIHPKTKSRGMAITADFGKGSSGGPVLDGAGEVVGMVVSTKSLAYHSLRVVLDEENSCLRKATREELSKGSRDDPDERPKRLGFSHQMTFKHCAPVSAIRKLIR